MNESESREWLRQREDRAQQQAPIQSLDNKPQECTCLRVLSPGNVELLYRGSTLTLGHDAKAKTITMFVLANRGWPISRDNLIDWLWPEVNPTHARTEPNFAPYREKPLVRQALRDMCAHTAEVVKRAQPTAGRTGKGQAHAARSDEGDT